MKKHEEQDIGKIEIKCATAKIEIDSIIACTVITFIILLLLPFAYIIYMNYDISFLTERISWLPIYLLACVLLSGTTYVTKTITAQTSIILIPFSLAIGILFGWAVTPIAFISYKHDIKKYTPLIEEDRKQNPEIWIAEFSDIVNFLIGDNEEISRSYVTEEVIKYREWLFKGQISRNEYIQLLREIVNK